MFESFVSNYFLVYERALAHDAARLALVVCLFLAFATFEFKFPAERGQTVAGRARNILILTILVVGGVFASTAVFLYFPWRPQVRPDGGILKSAFMVLAYMMVMDFFYYWYHRAQHKLSALWAMHSVHHSDEELNTTSAFRSFWLEMPLQIMLVTRPTLLLLGVDVHALMALPFIVTSIHIFTHANIRLQLGFLTPIILGPQVHRIHHSVEPRHWNTNYSQYFPMWDILFGTYCPPEKDEFPATGINTLASNLSLKAILIGPFIQWRRLLLQKRSKTSGRVVSTAVPPVPVAISVPPEPVANATLVK